MGRNLYVGADMTREQQLEAALEAADALNEQAAHVAQGGCIPAMNIHESARNLIPLVNAYDKARDAARAALAAPATAQGVDVASDCRQWFHFPIEMPLSADDQGPATVGVDATRITYEVWDQALTTHASFDNLPDAINESIRLNALPSPAPWQPPPEAEREDGFECLGWRREGEWEPVKWLAYLNRWWWVFTDDSLGQPTAFAPLPPAPGDAP
jgi:hypothetical protein